MLNLYCIFSILVYRLFICDSILLSRFWIIFTVIIRNSLSGRFLFCLVWWVFILLLYLMVITLSLHLVYIALFGVAFLYSGSLWNSLYCRVSSLSLGLYRWLIKVSWLEKLVSVFWWVELDLFSLKCNEVSSSEFGVGLVWLLAACIFVLRVMFLCCWRISLVCLALKLVGSWVELGFSVWRLLNELLSIYVPWSQEFSGVLMFWI